MLSREFMEVEAAKKGMEVDRFLKMLGDRDPEGSKVITYKINSGFILEWKSILLSINF